MNKKIIENIHPFNEIFYKTCFYNSAFPIIKKYGKSIEHILANDIVIYKLDKQENKMNFGVQYVECLPVEVVIQDLGINIVTEHECSDIITNIKEAIKMNKPCILQVDCYYLSIREDAYLKEHWPHALLIYGFDDDKKIFNIVEHRQRENLQYEHREIAYEDIKMAYDGYMKKFYDGIAPSYFEFNDLEDSGCSGSIKIDAITIYRDNVNDKKQLMIESLQHLKTYTNYYMSVVSSEENIRLHANDILKMLNNIINGKQVEHFKLEKLFGKEIAAFEILEDIIKDWRAIRIVVAKYTFTSVYRLEAFLKTITTLNEIYKKEINYHEKIMKMLNI